MTRGGLGFRFSLRAHRDPSTRAGRKYAKLNEGDQVLTVVPTNGSDAVLCASTDGHVLGVPLEEISILSGVGKGAMVMKVSEDQHLVGAVLALGPRDEITVETEKGRTLSYTLKDVRGSRAARGDLKSKRDRFARVVLPPPVAPSLEVT